ncbi:hypothetical protein [Streptosporangium sp. NBC_01756]|uniref:hypothetical protein n=1 Tax=Streptosporangium sp. NBC_01756 TaxID=2975950 RepID=UPI002DD9F280|nr:hypothetical protein [Streptosporangium sp. NBC_01756]WSC83532.1 DUF11 domain-containing protein [Streptosporangium sp. NBC_01756]
MAEIHPRTATRRTATLCGLGAFLAVTLATLSPAAAVLKPHPEDDDRKASALTSHGDSDKDRDRDRDKDKDKKAPVAAAPKLSISVDNGRTAAQEGDRLTYTVTVNNIGTDKAHGLDLTQSLPTGLHFVSADGHGTAAKGQVHWTVDVPAGKKATFHTTAEVRATPEDLLRLATVACASTKGDDKPLVCATHSDQLPAGAAAAEAARAAADPASRLWYAVAVAGLLALVLAGMLFLRRSRRRAGARRSSS